MSWLSGFSNRLKLTIPADSADSSLTDFPVMINLSSSSGKTGFDSTAVFDELGDDHQKRMAITKNDGTTQCPVEIEYWDATEEKAVLWTKVPTVYSSVDTDLYFYYDVTTSGNTDFVGDTGDVPAQSVWDDNFQLVMHMAQDPNGDVVDAIKDSTSTANHGTPDGDMTTADLVEGKIGKAISFDGIDDHCDVSSITVGINTTFSWIAKSDSSEQQQIMSGTSVESRFSMGGSQVMFGFGNTYPTTYFMCDHGVTITDLHIYTLVRTSDITKLDLYVDGQLADSVINAEGASVSLYNLGGKDFATSWLYYDGMLDEIRFSNTARSSDWIKATYYSTWDNLIVFQQDVLETAWLSDWSKRIKLTIDSDKIDRTLVDFPVAVTLFSATNASDIFDTLSTVSGTKKIAVTTDDGTSQCYVEIERWDWAEEEANLWTKVPIIDSDEDTVLYLYYDFTKDDNTSYVGDTGDTPAQNVWDDNFKLVMHMAQDPNGDVAGAIKDSTSNVNHGTPDGSMTTADLVDGKSGKGIEFDGSNDRIIIPHHSSLSLSSGGCLEAIYRSYDSNNWEAFISKGTTYPNDAFILAYAAQTPKISGVFNYTTFGRPAGNDGSEYITALPKSEFVYSSCTYDGADQKLYVNGILRDTDNIGSDTIITNTYNVFIGNRETESLWAKGVIDEVRISNISRSVAWVKATYYSNWDELVSFGSEQGMPTHYYYGYVTEEELPVSRTINLYNRNTGELISSTSSNINTGYYYLTTTISGEHFIVAIDSDAGKDYNALILDRLLPRGIE